MVAADKMVRILKRSRWEANVRPRVKTLVTRSKVRMSWRWWTRSPKCLVRRRPDAFLCQVMSDYNGYIGFG